MSLLENSRRAASIVLACALGFTPAAYAALPNVDSQGKTLPSLAPMLEKVLPAVVNISTRGRVRVQENPLMQDPFFRRFFGVPDAPRERPTQSLGSGVVIDARQGYIVTNNHVVDKADEIVVTLRDGRSLKAKLVGKDPEADIAVIKVPAENLVALPMADSDRLRVGDFVVAIGNPFGLGQTVTSGIVSAMGRTGLGIEGYEDFIQTDASINPGNSGGALVNLRGELVGVNTAILAPGGGNVGIGFAIPANMAKQITNQLVAHGEVRRGRLGVLMQDLTQDLANAFNIKETQGAVVAQVVKGSPAEKAGLQPGDVITAINGRKLRNAAELRNVLGLTRIGDQVSLDVQRDGRVRMVKATVDEPQQVTIKGDKLSPKLAGATFGTIEEGSPLYGDIDGVVVTGVDQGSPAWRGGLRKDDVVISVNRQRVTNFDEFRQAAARSTRQLLLNVRRGEAALFMLLQ